MRGALEPLDGVSKVDVTKGEARMRVEYDPTKLTVEQLLQALADADQPAKRAG